MNRQLKKHGSHACSVRVCRNNTNRQEGYSFFSYPRDKALAVQWAKYCKRQDLLEKQSNWIKTTYVCGKHFENKMFLNDIKNRLQPHAVPTLHLDDPVVDSCKYSDKSYYVCYKIAAFFFHIFILY